MDILGLVETHIRPTNTDGLLNSLTPLNYNLIKKPRCTGLGGGVGFLCRKSLSPSIVSSPVFSSFEIIILTFKSDYNSFVAACVYRPPGSGTTQFLEDVLALSGFLSSIGSNFIICGDINVHLDVECGDRSRFNNILQCCSLSQCVSGSTHILGHTPEVLISLVTVILSAMLMLETLSQTMLLCDANSTFPTQQPALKKWSLIVGIIELILTSSAMTLVIYHLYCPLEELWQSCMISIWLVLPRYLISMLLSSHITKQQSDEWVSDSYCMARSLRQQFERMWRKHKIQLNRSRLSKQIVWCNRLAYKDKGSYYTNLITANCDDPKKLWQSLRKVLHRISETVLPAHSSKKSLADTFVSFFTNKISKIRDTFPTSGSFNDASDSVPPAFNTFKPVTEDEVSKCTNGSPTKSCPLDPIPTFLLKNCLDILLPSIVQ